MFTTSNQHNAVATAIATTNTTNESCKFQTVKMTSAQNFNLALALFKSEIFILKFCIFGRKLSNDNKFSEKLKFRHGVSPSCHCQITTITTTTTTKKYANHHHLTIKIIKSLQNGKLEMNDKAALSAGQMPKHQQLNK